jgi:hypothetical protein
MTVYAGDPRRRVRGIGGIVPGPPQPGSGRTPKQDIKHFPHN